MKRNGGRGDEAPARDHLPCTAEPLVPEHEGDRIDLLIGTSLLKGGFVPKFLSWCRKSVKPIQRRIVSSNKNAKGETRGID